MSTRVSDLDFDHSVGVYGGVAGHGAVLLRTAERLDGQQGATFAVLDEDSQGFEAGYFYVIATAKAVLPSGWWATLLLYSVEPTMPVTKIKHGTTAKRYFHGVGEFEGAADLTSAQSAQRALDESRRGTNE